MSALTQQAIEALRGLAQRYGVSEDAATTMLFAVSNGGGSMAQFSHPEFGGSGQWMQGGMTMVGDMFNYGLQSKVSGLCSELSSLLRSMPVFAQPSPGSSGFSGGNWWPAELGSPSSSGGQNDARYAYFPGPRRLAIARNGATEVYDTLDHQIGGVQQQQGGGYGSLSFSSQYGTFSVDSLPRVSPPPLNAPPPPAQSAQPADQGAWASPAPTPTPHSQLNQGASPPSSQHDIFAALERLGELRDKQILSDAEFQAKKAELLARL